MARIQVYTTRVCGYCSMLKRLLTQKGVPFEETDVSGNAALRRWLLETTGRRTVPQVFIDGLPYGGYTDLVALDKAGRLDGLLGRSPTR
jgi:glutaredoxin 3